MRKIDWSNIDPTAAPSTLTAEEQAEEAKYYAEYLDDITFGETMNQINVIKPYKWNGLWVFDDPAKELEHEALVAGMPEMISYACEAAKVKNPEDGFLALFSKDPFPGAKICLEWVREEMGGNVYKWAESGLEGWLCPALFKYFTHAPEKMYIEVKSIS